jgi:MoxR-like ATPase
MSDVAAIHNLVQKRNELKTRSKNYCGSGCGGRSGVTLYFSGGHALLVGSGLAKTLMVNTLAQALGLDFKRFSLLLI